MSQDKWMLLSSLLLLLASLLQFVLHRGPQTDQVKDLEARLAEVEERVAVLLHTLMS